MKAQGFNKGQSMMLTYSAKLTEFPVLRWCLDLSHINRELHPGLGT